MAAPEPRAKNLADLYDLAQLDWAHVRRTLERHVVAVDGDAEGAARVALDVADLAQPRTAGEVVAAVDPEGADGGHVGPAVGVDRRQPEGVVPGSTGVGFLGQVGLEQSSVSKSSGE
jgi:hypothetical protein